MMKHLILVLLRTVIDIIAITTGLLVKQILSSQKQNKQNLK